MTRAPVVLAATLVLASAALTACSEPDPEDTGVADALERLPAVPDGEFVAVRYTNLAALREAADLEVPDIDDEEAVSAFATAASGFDEGSAPVTALPTSIDSRLPPDDFRERFGFLWVQADLVVDLQSAGTTFGWYGFADDVEVPDGLTERDTDGIYAEEDEGGLLLAVDGARAAIAADEPQAEAWLDPDDESLADDEVFADLAEVLDDEDVITALLSTVNDLPAIGIGLSVDDGDPAFVVAYRFDSDDEAEAGVDGLRDGWAELADAGSAEIDVADVEADGKVVQVTGTQDPAAAPLQLYTNFQLPLPE